MIFRPLIYWQLYDDTDAKKCKRKSKLDYVQKIFLYHKKTICLIKSNEVLFRSKIYKENRWYPERKRNNENVNKEFSTLDNLIELM